MLRTKKKICMIWKRENIEKVMKLSNLFTPPSGAEKAKSVIHKKVDTCYTKEGSTRFQLVYSRVWSFFCVKYWLKLKHDILFRQKNMKLPRVIKREPQELNGFLGCSTRNTKNTPKRKWNFHFNPWRGTTSLLLFLPFQPPKKLEIISHFPSLSLLFSSSSSFLQKK